MENNQISNTTTARNFEFIFGLILLALGSYRMYQLYIGIPFSKWRIWFAVFTLVLGVFKLYTFFKTKNNN